MDYVYIRSEPGLWTVGFYDPQGAWRPDSDHCTKDNAAERTAWLNGSSNEESAAKLPKPILAWLVGRLSDADAGKFMLWYTVGKPLEAEGRPPQ